MSFISEQIHEFYFCKFNKAVNKGVCPDELKHADIKPTHKKESRNEKENYRPVSILPNLSKIFERCMSNLKITLISYYQNISADLENGSAHSIAY